MDPTTILQALAGMAMAPGADPQGSSRYNNPYMWSPLTDRTLAPAIGNNQTAQMMAMFAPIITQMVAPELSSRIQSMSNIHPGLASQARRLQDMQAQFAKAQSAQQIAAIGKMGQAFGLSQDTVDTVSNILPIAGAIMPGLNNVLSRFDVSGAGFGYDAALMSMARAGGLSPNRIDMNSASAMARLYASQYQRDGRGFLEGTKVLDVEKTQGLTIAEMGQMRAGLTARGIVGDAYAGTNDVERIRAMLSEEDRAATAGATTISEMRQRGLTSDKLATAREGVISSNLRDSAPTEQKYAEVVHKMGSIFTSLQGNSEELLRMVEKLHGPISKLNPEDLDRTMTKFIKLLDTSGLQAEELAKGVEVFKARTGVSDTNIAMQAVAQVSGARRGAMRAGASEDGTMRIASETADTIGKEAGRLVGRGMGAFMTTQGLQALREAEETMANPNSTPEQRERAMMILTDPTKVDGIIAADKTSEANAYRMRAITGQVNADETRARLDATSELMGMSAQTRGELGLKVISGSLLSRLDSTMRAVVQTDAGKNAVNAAKQRIAQWLGKRPEDVSDSEVSKWTAGAIGASSPTGGADSVSYFLASMDIHGEKAEEIKKGLLRGDLSALSNAVGAHSEDLRRDLEAGWAAGIDTAQVGAQTEAEIAEQLRTNKVYRATNAATATIAMLEKGKSALGFKDFLLGGLEALGVVAPEWKPTGDQLKAIEGSGWGREYSDIQKITDDKEKARRMQVLAGDIAHTLKLGDKEVESYLGSKEGGSELLNLITGSRTSEEKTRGMSEDSARRKLGLGDSESGGSTTKIEISVKDAAVAEALAFSVAEGRRGVRGIQGAPVRGQPTEQRR